VVASHSAGATSRTRWRTGMAHCGELEDRPFMDDPNVKRFDTLPVFLAVKTGLEVPARPHEAGAA
jgi:hypothetical protein